ncbi:phosphate acyltransferase [Gammaproteobacteria bacterium SCGC AG-212-F23]|nr:phosphate acyltransferase [Gammaproteobacteria bacterium SCGC AG-212-F23]
MKPITIAVDAMGGDHGPSVTVPAALQALLEHEVLQLILVGDEAVLRTELQKRQVQPSPRLVIQHASQRVEMNESPSQALRSKKDSSMRVAINLVKEGRAQACVSAGNTGALMATARFVLKTLPGIDRPAIISTFPTLKGNKNMRMLDLGANVDSTPENLLQFAVMGSLLASAVDGVERPAVYLLNIGEEDIKGNELVKSAANLLANSQVIHYAGFIEGDHLFKGDADVVVCDGFVGNVALKASEGIASFILKLLKDAFNRNWLTRLAGLITLPVLKSLAKRVDPDRYNGASLLGLQGIVIKSHGSAKVEAFSHAIAEAIVEVDKNILQTISKQVEQLLN